MTLLLATVIFLLFFLVAYFFRRAFELIRQSGTFGLICTNTIAQGDTRQGGLRWICQHNGTIYEATNRLKWPGIAAVIVSLVYLQKGYYSGIKYLNGRKVSRITAFLFHCGSDENPKDLISNKKRAFLGSKIYGNGFLFDDKDDQATPIVEMHRLIEQNPKNAEVIFPYIGGEEVNSSPTHLHNRYVGFAEKVS